MSRKRWITFGAIVGMVGGSYVPQLWDGAAVSFETFFFVGIGGVLGIAVGYKLTGWLMTF